MDGQAAVAAFVQQFKQQVSQTWGIPLGQITVTTVSLNGETLAVARRRRLAVEMGAVDPPPTNLEELLRSRLPDLTLLVQRGQTQPASSEHLAALQAQEVALLASLTVQPELGASQGRRLASASADSASIDFSVTTILDKPGPPSQPFDLSSLAATTGATVQTRVIGAHELSLLLDGL
jgi:hypothetical protein